jgi:PPP family 3-phenylpropionic acid transporter
LVFSLAITAFRWFLVSFYADSFFILALSQLMHAASFGLFHSASMLFISSHFTPCQQSRGQAIYLGGVYGVGGAIGAYIAGALWLDGIGASNAFFSAGLAAFIATLVMLFLPDKHIKKPSQ